jgi:hypothetical protein
VKALFSEVKCQEHEADNLPLSTAEDLAPGTHFIGGLVHPRTGPDDMEKRTFFTLPGLERRPLGRPARSQSLYRLRYPVPSGVYICI